MAANTVVLTSKPGIKRDGTVFEGDYYVDGQWVRFQRNLPRKIWGYRSISKYLTQISRGLHTYTEGSYIYCHSGSQSYLERFTLDINANASVISNRTPIAAGSTGSVTLLTGAAGSVDMITVNGVSIMSAPVTFTTDLATTAAAVAANITAYTSSPEYTATSAGETVIIQASTTGTSTNGFVVGCTATTITTSQINMSGGTDAYIPDPDNCWMFDVMYSSVTLSNYLIAHVAPNENNIASTGAGQIYVGDITGTAPLTAVTIPANANATGGIVVLHPYLFYYGTAGIVGWSIAGDPTDLSGSGSGQARVAGQKIVKGLPLRAGAGSAPAGLFWAYDALIRCTFAGGSTVFNFDTISAETTILSQNSVIEYDGIYYWCGVDRFLMFNGVVRELPNTMNLNYFFDGLNRAGSQKVFAIKVPRYGEIWWCYPRGSATECTHAIIYNVREGTWYDTQLPNSGRSAGSFSPAFPAPLMTGVVSTGSGYKVWQHEYGVDEIDGTTVNPIPSYFETCDLSLAVMNNQNRKMKINYIEPDFVQTGDMSVQIVGRANARAPTVYGNTVVFPANPGSDPAQQIVPMKEQRRELRVKFTSNAITGDYQMGQIIIHVEPGDGTITG